METKAIVEALGELRKNEKKVNFEQTVDLIVNLKGYELKKNPIDVVVPVKHSVKDKKICGFLEKNSDVVDTVTKEQFSNFKDKKKLKKLVKNYDFFLAAAKLMPSVATTFGRVLGPQGKMPSPKLGLLMQESPEAIKELVDKINKSIRVRVKEPSIKIPIGKEKMSDEDIADNVSRVYEGIVKALLKGKENVRSVMLKFTMIKPVRVKL